MFQSFNFFTSDFLFDFYLFFQAQNNEKEDNNENKSSMKSMLESFTQSSQKNSELKIDLISVEASLTEDGSKEENKSEKLVNESNQVIQKNDDNHIANIEEVHEDVVNEVENGLPLKNVLSKELPVENEKKLNGRMDMFCIKV